MTDKPPEHALSRRVWDALTRPSNLIVEEEARRRARFLAAVMVLVLPLGVTVSMAAELAQPASASPVDAMLRLGANATILAAYVLSRSHFYKAGAALGVSIALFGSWLNAVSDPDMVRVAALLDFSVTGVLLCAVVFPLRVTAPVSLLNIVMAIMVLAFRPEVAAIDIVVIVATLVLLTAIVVPVSSLMKQDLAQLQERGDALRRSEERYSLAARGANDGLWDWDLVSDSVYYSPRWYQMLDLDEHDHGDTPAVWLDRVHQDDLGLVTQRIREHIEGTVRSFECPHRVLDAAGEERWLLARGLAVRDAMGRPVRMAGSMTDITDRKRVEDQLVHEAYHDALTGLPNRACFIDRLQNVMGRARGRGGVYAVLYLDLDRFKVVNDSLGHALGNEVLIETSKRLHACLRPHDMVARLGGDEFVVLLDALRAAEDVEQVARRIQEGVARPIHLEGHEIVTTASIGIAPSALGYKRPEDLIRAADTAMYRAKATGKARHQLFDRQMHDAALARLRTESDLRRALEREEFEVYYQPIIDMGPGGVVGFEALVRWNHPERGRVAPDDFIGVAEETGLIDPIGFWVLETACAQTQAWNVGIRADTPLRVNVNLSGRQFRAGGLHDRVLETLSRTGLPGSALTLEITETVIMESSDEARTVLAALRAAGVAVCIDDFGTGYSSLSYLHAFELDGLKIDRSFVSRIGPNGPRPQIIKTIVDLSRSLSLAVTAEGIETPMQYAQLRDLGCDTAQGYLFSKPVPHAAAEQLLRDGPSW